jgi:Fe-S cluster assembly protein SufD
MATNIMQNLAQEHVRETYDLYKKSPHIYDISTVEALRQKSFDEFNTKGFPTKKNENYKYTTLEQHFSNKYQYYPFSTHEQINIDEIFKCDVPSLDTQLIVLVNGWFYESSQQPRLKKEPNGIIIGSLLEAMKQFPDLVFEHYNKYASHYSDEMHLINQSLMQDGLFVYIPKDAQFEKPLQIINLVVADEMVQIYPRHLIVSNSDKHNQILVCDHSLNPNPFIMNGSLEFYLGEHAYLEFYRMQNAHNHSVQITNNFISQQQGSHFHSSIITLHGGTVRNNFFVELSGKEAVSNLYGLWLADKNQHIDYNTFVKHSAPQCESNQFFKGILDDESTGIFSGKILVDKDAQKTNAYQSNKNLIINSNAKSRSKPHLEIYADDVKCSHGSATGKLDDEAMFYLRSRGISHKEACQLLMFAFASDITKQILIEPLKQEVEHLVERRLRGELSRCNRCNISCS